jgi:DNA polymerase-3 subunit alpha
MVYQEQVMQMAQVIGGYSLGGADLLRRAMGKKKPEEMAEQSKIFAKGAIENGLTQEKADEIFKLMEAFAGYGFNKSHAAAYALLAYHTAWLKAHYVAEFMAANLSLAMDDTDKVRVLFEDAKSNQVTILPPNINQGEYRFVPIRLNPNNPSEKVTHIKYGLGAVRGTGENAILEIVRARQEKPFVHLFDFCSRVDRRVVNRRSIEALIRAGAFDEIAPNGIHGRATLLESLANAMTAAEQALASANQVSLFGMPGEEEGSEPEYVQTAEWGDKKRLQEEKLALGFCLSGHLFDAYAEEVRKVARVPLNKLSLSSGEKLVAGIIVSQRTNKTRNGVMYSLVIDDGTDQIELTVFEDVYESYRECFKEDELLIAKIQTKVQPANENFSGSTRHIVQAAMNIAMARLRYAQSIHFAMNNQVNIRQLNEKSEGFFKQVQNAHQTGARKTHDGLRMTAELTSISGICELEFPQNWRLYPDDASIQSFNNLLHQVGVRSNLKIIYANS